MRPASGPGRALRPGRRATAALVTVVVLAVAVAVAILVQGGRTATGADPAAAPRNVAPGTDGAGFAVGRPDAPVTLDVYEDFLCPVCRAFEEQVGSTIARLVDDGTVRVRYRPIAILDRLSTDDYSTRALNAAAVVADAAGPEAFLAFHDALFADQPPEGGAGLSDARLVALARSAGADGAAVATGIRDLRFGDWAAAVTERASLDGITGTPTVLVDGVRLTDRTNAGLLAAVQAAEGDRSPAPLRR